jgi:hypothetical protein
MAQGIIPDSHENRLAFFKTLKSVINLPANATAFGWAAAKLTAVNAVLDPLIAAYQALVDAENAVIPANANATQVFGNQKAALQSLIAELKANPGCTDGMEAQMGLVTTSTRPAPADMHPTIKAAAHPGFVRLSGSKDYADLVNIYMRLAGTAAWTLVGIRRQKFPFDDQTPLKAPGTPETREYQARAVVGEDESGLPSDIVQVTFGG